MCDLRGVIPVIPTPFHDDESVDLRSLKRAVEFVSSQRLGGMVLPAYASEFYKLTEIERESVVAAAIETNGRRVPLIAQANHGSARAASELAQRYERLGADLISFALPRQFATSANDLQDFSAQIAGSVSIPVMIQDFNPGGPTIGADFVAAIQQRCPNIKYVKLEDLQIIDKLVAIRSAIGERVGIIIGWGGYTMLEAIPLGIRGIMPGVSIADLLNRVFTWRQESKNELAYDLFARLMPYIAFSLTNLELSHAMEKRLLVRRGIIATDKVRSLSLTPSTEVSRHMDFLIERMLHVIHSA